MEYLQRSGEQPSERGEPLGIRGPTCGFPKTPRTPWQYDTDEMRRNLTPIMPTGGRVSDGR